MRTWKMYERCLLAERPLSFLLFWRGSEQLHYERMISFSCFSKAKSGSGWPVALETHQPGNWKTFVCFRSAFPIPFQSFVLVEAPQVNQIHGMPHFTLGCRTIIAHTGGRAATITSPWRAGLRCIQQVSTYTDPDL